MIPKPGIASVRQLFHIEQLRRSGHEHGQDISAFCLLLGAPIVVIVIPVVILQQTDIAHFVQELLKFLLPSLSILQSLHISAKV